MIDKGDEYSGASFSPCGTYRYRLWRAWDATFPTMTIIGLNPSTADEQEDDMTIRRCINFARREGCGKLLMVNLFAFRATEPKVMMKAVDPIGPENDAALVLPLSTSKIVIAAWSIHGGHRGRDREVWGMLKNAWPVCLGITKNGHPRHPSRIAADTPLVEYKGPR